MDSTLPQTLYVHMEDDGDDGYFPISDTDFTTKDAGTVVGIYELKDTKRVKVETTLG